MFFNELLGLLHVGDNKKPSTNTEVYVPPDTEDERVEHQAFGDSAVAHGRVPEMFRLDGDQEDVERREADLQAYQAQLKDKQQATVPAVQEKT